VHLRAHEVADEGAATLRLRAGADAVTLSNKSVAVIGIGAVGSFLADMLNRNGVDRLLLQDGQVLRPGNCVRHLAGREFVGWNKALAVKRVIGTARQSEMRHVTTGATSLLLPDDAHGLLLRHDLVVDATANGPTTLMLGSLSQTTGRPFLSICVQREGGVVRCDRWPLRETESHLPPVPPGGASSVREGGCGDPVSLTPPNAVLAAAELACRMALDLLVGTRRLPATLIHVLSAQPDSPYDRVSVLA
jgi:molybdopterin/thiamine biosynthesis adenylyltransferase